MSRDSEFALGAKDWARKVIHELLFPIRMNPRLKSLLLSCLVASSLQAQELAPFAPPWDDGASGPTDISATLPSPAGKFGRVCVKDGHLFTGDQRLRLFGCDFTAGACFPDHDTADKVSARMAKFGLNVVRFHFLDSVWGTVRLINYDSGDSHNWNADSLDRLDYFIAKLREHGIYANLNLLVGRRFGLNDGVDGGINKLEWKVAHAVGFFYQPHLEAQKQYARQLLSHRNPYTKLTYAEDPAVATVEINNENGLIHTWMGGGFNALPEPFAGDLSRQWNAWLAARYPNTPALAKAWNARNEPLGAEMLANADFAKGVSSWSLEQHEGARVEARTEGGAALLRVARTGKAGWHVQLNQAKLHLTKGGIYSIHFRAAADKARKISIYVMQAHEPWKSVGLYGALNLTEQLQDFSYTFIAAEDDANARFGFGEMNQENAEFRFADLSLKPGGRVGLMEDESVEKHSIHLPKTVDSRPLPPEGQQDWIRFLWETERHYWQAMKHCIVDEIGVKAPVVGTIVGNSTPNLQADMDIVDGHAYWEHPHFPGKPWDRNNWVVHNISMVDYPERATVTSLAFERVAGKPFMVSEYNHPAPNTHAGEGPLFLAIMGGLQDWDALYLYTYSHEENRTKAGCIPDFFDVGQHPTIMANVPIASLLFRRGDMTPGKELVSVPLPVEHEIDLIAQQGHAWSVLSVGKLGLDLRTALCRRIALNLASTQTNLPTAVIKSAQTEFTSDTDELIWRLPSKDQGRLEMRSPRSKVLIGHADGQTVDLGQGVQVDVKKTLNNWCTVSLTLLEGESFDRAPGRALLVATGYTENSGMGWKNPQKDTVGNNWGHPPSLVEPVSVTIRLPRAGATLPVVYALDDRGQRTGKMAVTASGTNSAQIEIGPPQKTLWYEIDYRPLK